MLNNFCKRILPPEDLGHFNHLALVTIPFSHMHTVITVVIHVGVVIQLHPLFIVISIRWKYFVISDQIKLAAK